MATCQVYEVMDAYSEVLLGYNISKTERYSSQFDAFKSAILFSGHRPFEIRVDNQGGHKKLMSGDLMSGIARVAIRTQPYNAKSKTIESVFGRFQQQIMKRDWYFTGQNVKAKRLESQENKEFKLKQPIEAYPTLAEMTAKYSQRRDEWNTGAHPTTGTSRLEMYRNSVNPQAPEVSDLDRINIFWLLRPLPITYRAEGLKMVENKEKYLYVKMLEGYKNIPDIEWMRKNVDKEFWIRFDPSDLSIIYCYEKDTAGDLRFVTQMDEKIMTNRGKQLQENWEASYYKDIEERKKDSRLSAHTEMEEIMKENDRSAEDYGMKATSPLGVNWIKKKSAVPTLGEAMKEESNMEEPTEAITTLSDDDEEDESIYNLI